MNTPAAKKLVSARTSLVLDQPFFGALALSLTPKEDTSCDTAWVDGRSMGYNPDFILSLSHAELVGLIAHEVMHCAMGHPWRRDARDGKQWNIACDYAINGDLKTSGFSLPKDGLFPDASQQGKSSEWIFARLPQPKPGKDKQGNGGNGNGTPQPGKGKPDPAGEVRDAPTQADAEGNPAPTEGEWKQRTAEALQAAKLQGSLSGGLARMVEAALDKRIDVRSLLLRFMTERTLADYSWSMPNRRFISSGIFMPSLESKGLGEIGILVDTSGSINNVSLQHTRGILEQVLDECQPAGITIYFVDTKIAHTERIEQGAPLVFNPKGGGGTDFRSCFAELEHNPPVCLIGLSDLYATWPQDVPSFPVLWLTDSETANAPFGEVIRLEQ